LKHLLVPPLTITPKKQIPDLLSWLLASLKEDGIHAFCKNLLQANHASKTACDEQKGKLLSTWKPRSSHQVHGLYLEADSDAGCV